MDDLTPMSAGPFEAIRHADEAGEYWTARELMPLLEYSLWYHFEEAIQRAMADCAKAGRDVTENFTPGSKVSGKRGPKQKDYHLTRYACRLIAMTAQITGSVAAQAHTYFSDRVDDAEQLLDPEVAFREWRRRAIESYVTHATALSGLSAGWMTLPLGTRSPTSGRCVASRKKEYPILTERLHMGAFGLNIAEHKALNEFEVTYRGKKLIYNGDLPPAMTATEVALNTLASTVARELHASNDAGIHSDRERCGYRWAHRRGHAPPDRGSYRAACRQPTQPAP